ncbi:MAG: lipid-binding SYLF domain-containing protein [Candidatus Korobacteraceae bacterium]
MKKTIAAALLIFLMTTWAWGQSRNAQVDRVQTASTVLSQIMSAPDRAIPDGIMSGAKCIAIIPSSLKASFIFGANYGKGVATCRTEHGWSAPVFFRLTGGSFGFQAGGQASDLVLVIRTDDGMQHLLQSKFKLGADASASAGPVGRDAQAMTDLTLRAQVLTYSRSRGLFLGVSLSGGVIRQDGGDTRAFYGGKDWTFYSLLNGEVPAPKDSMVLLNTVEKYAPTPKVRAQATPPPVVAAPVSSATPAETPTTASPAAPALAPTATSDSTTDEKPAIDEEPAAAPATPGSTATPPAAATTGTVNP